MPSLTLSGESASVFIDNDAVTEFIIFIGLVANGSVPSSSPLLVRFFSRIGFFDFAPLRSLASSIMRQRIGGPYGSAGGVVCPLLEDISYKMKQLDAKSVSDFHRELRSKRYFYPEVDELFFERGVCLEKSE